MSDNLIRELAFAENLILLGTVELTLTGLEYTPQPVWFQSPGSDTLAYTTSFQSFCDVLK